MKPVFTGLKDGKNYFLNEPLPIYATTWGVDMNADILYMKG